MRKLTIFAMAALMLLTAQCKKKEQKPEEMVMVPITGTVDFGGGSKTEITTAGYITPVSGDMIYIYSGGSYVGYVTCTPTTGQQFNCSGEIAQTSLGTTCTFMYLGTGSKEADGSTAISNTSSTISFADQSTVVVADGKITNMNKFHVGGCSAAVSSEGTVTLPMLSKMAIAYFQLKDGSDNPIASTSVTISGLSATATIDKTNGTLTGSGTGSITVTTDANGCFYMALIPQSGAVEFSFAGGGKEGTKNFPNGIRENSFYSQQASGSPIAVTMVATLPAGALSGLFTVNSSGTKVRFSQGNLYCVWDGTSKSTPEWHFEDNQYDFRTYSDKASCINGSYNASGGTPTNNWGTFGWSTNSTTYGMSISTIQTAYSGDFVDWGGNTILAGSDATTGWRTLSSSEWNYLLVTRKVTYGGAQKESYGHGTVNGVSGLIILPDNWDGSVCSGFVYGNSEWSNTFSSITTPNWSTMEAAGAVFLPAAGVRSGTVMDLVGTEGRYWSSTYTMPKVAYYERFAPSVVEWASMNRFNGACVRLACSVE